MKKQIAYTGNEANHPFLEQTYMHMAIMYKNINNLGSSLVMWRSLMNVHIRQYGEYSHILAADYKNIGTCQIGLGQPKEGVENLMKAELLSRKYLEMGEDPEDEMEEKKQLAEIYFAMYLGYVTMTEWDKAIRANNNAKEINAEILGENDLNVANNYYLGAQIHLKKLDIDEALRNVDVANKIIDTKPSKEPLLFARYRFLRAKLYKLKEKNKEALSDLDEAIRATEGNPQLYNDELEIKNYRRSFIACLTEEEYKKFSINDEVEQNDKLKDKEKKKRIEKKYRISVLEDSLRKQGIDPKTVDTEKIIDQDFPDKDAQKDDEDDEDGCKRVYKFDYLL